MIRKEQRTAQKFKQLPFTNRRESYFLFFAFDCAAALTVNV